MTTEARPPCDYPVTLIPGVADVCGEPSEWRTDDLQEIHHLCQSHCDEALTMNDFRTEPTS